MGKDRDGEVSMTTMKCPNCGYIIRIYVSDVTTKICPRCLKLVSVPH